MVSSFSIHANAVHRMKNANPMVRSSSINNVQLLPFDLVQHKSVSEPWALIVSICISIKIVAKVSTTAKIDWPISNVNIKTA